VSGSIENSEEELSREKKEDSEEEDTRPTEKVLIDFGKQHTKLVEFAGAYFSEDLNFEGHKIYFVVPHPLQLAPSNVLFFELLWLSSPTSDKDNVIAWGAFPLLNSDLNINQGKFKLPMINGDTNFDMNKFKDIETRYHRNLDEWLCNLYIEVK
jgi:hypothetical protein